MSMDFRLGLVARDMAGTCNVASWQQQGLGTSAVVEYHLTTAEDAQAVVNQLIGYRDLPSANIVVPLVWDTEPTRSGFYRLTGVELSIDNRFVLTNRVNVKFDLELIRSSTVLGGEHILSGADRSAVPAHASWTNNETRPWIAWPSTWDYGASGTGLGSYNVPISRYTTTTEGLYVIEGVEHFYSLLTSPTPETFYDAAAFIKAGNPLHPVVGRQVGDADPAYWELSNGLVKIGPSSDPLALFSITHRAADGSVWSTRTGDISWWSANLPGDVYRAGSITGISVVANTPEKCTLRLTRQVGQPMGVQQIDITLRRGSRFVQVTFANFLAGTPTFGYSSAFSGGVAMDLPAGSADAPEPQIGVIEGVDFTDGNGHKFRDCFITGDVKVAGWTFTADGRFTNGGSHVISNFAVGSVVGGSLAADVDEAWVIERQYYAGVSEVFQVVQQ